MHRNGLALSFRALTKADLDVLVRRARLVARGVFGEAENMLVHGIASCMVIERVMGREWAQRHFNPQKTQSQFFHEHFPKGADLKTISAVEALRKHLRTAQVAQLLYELQGLENLNDRLVQLKETQVESVFAELQIVQALRTSGTPTWLRPEKGPHGEPNYDLDLMLDDGSSGAAEIKCRIETTELSQSGIVSRLKDARRQLRIAGDRAKVIWMSIPGAWLRQPTCIETLKSAANEFFRNKDGICALVYYFAQAFDASDGRHGTALGFIRETNPATSSSSAAVGRMLDRMARTRTARLFLEDEVERAAASPDIDRGPGAVALLTDIRDGHAFFRVHTNPPSVRSFPVNEQERGTLLERLHSDPESFWVALDEQGRHCWFSNLE